MKRHWLKSASVLRGRLITTRATAWPRIIIVILSIQSSCHRHHHQQQQQSTKISIFPLQPTVYVTCRPFCHYWQFIVVISTIHTFNSGCHFLVSSGLCFLWINSVQTVFHWWNRPTWYWVTIERNAHLYVCACACVCVCVCVQKGRIYGCIYVCMHIYIHIYIHPHPPIP